MRVLLGSRKECSGGVCVCVCSALKAARLSRLSNRIVGAIFASKSVDIVLSNKTAV